MLPTAFHQCSSLNPSRAFPELLPDTLFINKHQADLLSWSLQPQRLLPAVSNNPLYLRWQQISQKRQCCCKNLQGSSVAYHSPLVWSLSTAGFAPAVRDNQPLPVSKPRTRSLLDTALGALGTFCQAAAWAAHPFTPQHRKWMWFFFLL